MTARSSPGPAASPIRWDLVIEGLLVAAAGVLAVAFPFVAGWAATVVAGWTLLGVGVLRAVGAFSRRGRERAWALGAAVCTLALAGLILYAPGVGAVSATLVIAVYLTMDGIVSFVEAVRRHNLGLDGWLWTCAAALGDWLLAALLVVAAAFDAPVALGLVLGVSLISAGAALAAVGAARLPPREHR